MSATLDGCHDIAVKVVKDVLFKAFCAQRFLQVSNLHVDYLQGDPDPLQASDPWGGWFVVLPAIEL